jgi:predicted  nucleic acid-binding Zn-ribbon protein
MSAKERPEAAAFRELETLVRSLGEEVAVWRRRAVQAEEKLKEPAARGKTSGADSEAAMLKTRLHRAEERVRQMMESIRFLRQQLQADGASAASGRR